MVCRLQKLLNLKAIKNSENKTEKDQQASRDIQSSDTPDDMYIYEEE